MSVLNQLKSCLDCREKEIQDLISYVGGFHPPPADMKWATENATPSYLRQLASELTLELRKRERIIEELRLSEQLANVREMGTKTNLYYNESYRYAHDSSYFGNHAVYHKDKVICTPKEKFPNIDKTSNAILQPSISLLLPGNHTVPHSEFEISRQKSFSGNNFPPPYPHPLSTQVNQTNSNNSNPIPASISNTATKKIFHRENRKHKIRFESIALQRERDGKSKFVSSARTNKLASNARRRSAQDIEYQQHQEALSLRDQVTCSTEAQRRRKAQMAHDREVITKHREDRFNELQEKFEKGKAQRKKLISNNSIGNNTVFSRTRKQVETALHDSLDLSISSGSMFDSCRLNDSSDAQSISSSVLGVNLLLSSVIDGDKFRQDSKLINVNDRGIGIRNDLSKHAKCTNCENESFIFDNHTGNSDLILAHDTHQDLVEYKDTYHRQKKILFNSISDNIPKIECGSLKEGSSSEVLSYSDSMVFITSPPDLVKRKETLAKENHPHIENSNSSNSVIYIATPQDSFTGKVVTVIDNTNEYVSNEQEQPKDLFGSLIYVSMPQDAYEGTVCTSNFDHFHGTSKHVDSSDAAKEIFDFSSKNSPNPDEEKICFDNEISAINNKDGQLHIEESALQQKSHLQIQKEEYRSTSNEDENIKDIEAIESSIQKAAITQHNNTHSLLEIRQEKSSLTSADTGSDKESTCKLVTLAPTNLGNTAENLNTSRQTSTISKIVTCKEKSIVVAKTDLSVNKPTLDNFEIDSKYKRNLETENIAEQVDCACPHLGESSNSSNQCTNISDAFINQSTVIVSDEILSNSRLCDDSGLNIETEFDENDSKDDTYGDDDNSQSENGRSHSENIEENSLEGEHSADLFDISGYLNSEHSANSSNLQV